MSAKKIAKENGMVKPQQKRKYLHFVWLAKWQMDETMTHEKIADEFSKENPEPIEVQAISKAIKLNRKDDLLKEIAFTETEAREFIKAQTGNEKIKTLDEEIKDIREALGLQPKK